MDSHGAARFAGRAQGMVLLAAGVLPAMGVVLIAPNVALLNDAFAGTPGTTYLVPLVLTMPALCIVLFSPAAGWFVDRFGRRSSLLAGLVLYGLFGMAPLLLHGLPAILLSRAGVGIVEALIMTAAFALIADYFADDRRNRWLAASAAFTGASAIALKAIGGILGEFGWRVPFAAYGLALLIACFAAFAIWEPAREVRSNAGSTKAASPHRLFSRPFLIVCCVQFLSSLLFFILPLQGAIFLNAQGVASPAMIGTFLAVAAIGNPIGAYLFRYVSDCRLPVLVTISYTVSGIGLIGMALAPTLGVAVTFAFINTFGGGLLIPAIQSAGMRSLPAKARGRGGGALISVMSLGQFTSPLVAVMLTQFTGAVDRTFLVLGIVSTVAAVIACHLAMTRRAAASFAAAPAD